jgi:hypothetical protein
MVTVRAKGAIPRQEATLCQTFRWAQIVKGFPASEEVVYCRVFYRMNRISFALSECPLYDDKRLASKTELEEIAWFLTTRQSGRRVGFVSAARCRELEAEVSAAGAVDRRKPPSTE